MSGPLQWTGAGFVPATGTLVRPAPATPHEADDDVDDVEFVQGTVPVRSMPRPRKAPPRPINVVRLAKQRLREVEREIKRLKALETERDELRRLLDAAKAPARARTLKSVG